MTDTNYTLDDVLNAVVVEEPEPTYEALTRWIAQYPEYRDALARFFATWALQETHPDDTRIDEATLASRATSYALDLLHRRDARALLDVARDGGVSPQELAARTGLDDSIVHKLDRRRLRDVPTTCVTRIADVLRVPPTRVGTMVTGPPLVAAGGRYKAKSKPAAVAEDFASAVESSTLSEEGKRFWRSEIARSEQQESSGPQ